MRVLIFVIVLGYAYACGKTPSFYQSRKVKTPGDNGYEIKINENPQKYVPGNIYTMYLTAPRIPRSNRLRRFTRFTVNVESTSKQTDSPQNVGNFQLYGDDIASFNEECINTISETNTDPKSEVFFMWSAPPPGSGCVSFKAMIFEDSDHWYSEDGKLTKTLCEQKEDDVQFDNEKDCCACDEAKYNIIFEGIWSNKTHPKDFPFSLWLTHFSDVIGASHEKNFSFWGEGQLASEGFRSLAEWGSVRLMETELRAKSQFLRTIIKASGLWYPHVNTNTTTSFKVDIRHHLISLASMFGPSPDWVVGINGLNLCLKNCTWMEKLTLDLFPYDAGTDSGISYMSPNAETSPRERMYRITTTYPEDPRAPFYDPSKKEMHPLARLYLTREKLIPKNCDESFLTAQLDVSENNEDTSRPECDVTEYTDWSECSVTCGKGLRMRTREYKMAEKAKRNNCNRQLVSKEMCVAAVAECEVDEHDSQEIDALGDNTGVCATTDWSGWSTCSETCGAGTRMRTRKFVDRKGRKKCPHISIMEKEKCMNRECRADELELPDPLCPTTQWSDWSPCSASCGKGIKLRTRLLLVDPSLQQQCSSRVEMIQQLPCEDVPTCFMDMNVAKVVCMQDSDPGPCQGYYNRWWFDSTKLRCLPFIFGGCRGNRNNFLTEEQCMDTCQIVKDAILGSPAITAQITKIRPVDCELTEWSEWSSCSTSCGRGYKERYRVVKRRAENGGRCPGSLFQRRGCFVRACL
ncbi:extracellular matrix protein f-spondin [Leptinotarsa decemlineata]|uniref:extracellular matrix protein f-spondin n=1 Tax=Leptinotarsa decemlineata TaxID=7539 RepID=UPI000C2527CC|nr:spondin-1 [Leptinotarsa decemlineata]